MSDVMITGGVVSVEDGVKKNEEYTPPRKVRVELRFDVAEGADHDAAIEQVVQTAQAHVAKALGMEAAAPAKQTRARKALDKTVAEQHEENMAAAAKSSQATAKVLSDKEKLAAAAGLIPAEPAVKPEPDPAAIEEDPLADLMGEKAPEPVTDAELNAAIQAKNKEIKDPVRIRGVIAEYNGGPGKVLADIPADKRHEFLEKIKALKAS